MPQFEYSAQAIWLMFHVLGPVLSTGRVVLLPGMAFIRGFGPFDSGSRPRALARRENLTACPFHNFMRLCGKRRFGLQRRHALSRECECSTTFSPVESNVAEAPRRTCLQCRSKFGPATWTDTKSFRGSAHTIPAHRIEVSTAGQFDWKCIAEVLRRSGFFPQVSLRRRGGKCDN